MTTKRNGDSLRFFAPWWAWAIILAMGGLQLLAHCWTALWPPDGLVWTGLHIPDSAIFLYSMRMFRTGFESLYATCHAVHGDHYFGYFPLPYLWLYGLLGLVAQVLHVGDYVVYASATAASVCVFLAAVYAFLRRALREHADTAFLLFALSGGLGGVVWLAAVVLGLNVEFMSYLRRFAICELMEGTNVLPMTFYPRLYYTLPLAACLVAVTLVMRFLDGHTRRRLMALALLLVLAGSVINARCGVFLWLVLALYLWSGTTAPMRQRAMLGGVMALPVLAGCLVTRALLQTNPATLENMLTVANMAIWFSPLVCVMFVHLFVAGPELWRRRRGLDGWARVCAYGALGYLAAFSVLFLAYQAYYGNLLTGRDAAVATVVSDPALLGAVVGALFALRRRGATAERDPYGWIILWLLAFVTLGISAFGQGWFLRFGPHRLQVLIWLPLCMVSALGLARLRSRWTMAAKVCTAILIGCGVCSIAAGFLCFQTPIVHVSEDWWYPSLHAEVMMETDARVIDAIGEGRVLAPKEASDAVVFRKGNPVVYGVGSFNLADEAEMLLRGEVDAFLMPDVSEDERRRVAERLCADYVFYPDWFPLDGRIAELRAYPWLDEVAHEGNAVLFRVKKDELRGTE